MRDPLIAVPTLDEIALRPAMAADLPPEAARVLLARCVVAQAALIAPALATTSAAKSTGPGGLCWLTPKQVAARLGVKTGYVLELCRRGVLPSEKLGKYRRIPEEGFTEWQRAGLDS